VSALFKPYPVRVAEQKIRVAKKIYESSIIALGVEIQTELWVQVEVISKKIDQLPTKSNTKC
jgi:hypothetical protein